jgi:predicted NBD/HSP70 family sugar kinase
MSANLIVFDIGGTWFRSGILTPENKLEKVTRKPAINYKNAMYKSIDQLQNALIDYLIDTVNELGEALPPHNIRAAGISLGAALNAHTGLILNSGPLWGPDCLPLDLVSALNKRQPRVKWAVVNDITAALMRFAQEPENKKALRLMLLTVSTGIGCRTYDMRSRTVPVDRIHGLQGEIGHIPVIFMYDGNLIDLECDCGGANHLNAFCSGRGIEALILHLAGLYEKQIRTSALCDVMYAESGDHVFQCFAQSLRHNDAFAISILESITKPIASALIHALTFDPEIDPVILTGGVLHCIGEMYTDSLFNHLNRQGMYQIASRDPQYFNRRIRIAKADDSGLIGAGLYLRSQL